MKKRLSLTVLVMISILTACSGNVDETVCTTEFQTVKAQSEGDEITSITVEYQFDLSEMAEEEVSNFVHRASNHLDCDRQRDELVCFDIFYGERLEGSTWPLSLEVFIADAEVAGASCN